MKALELRPKDIETAITCCATIAQVLNEAAFRCENQKLREAAAQALAEVRPALAALEQLAEFLHGEPQIWTLKSHAQN